MESIGTWWMWAGFAVIVVVMLAIDLFAVGGGRQHRVTAREAATWSGVWVAVSLLFALMLWGYLDATAGRAVPNEKSLQFVTGYLIEKSLAIDNVFMGGEILKPEREGTIAMARLNDLILEDDRVESVMLGFR